VNKVLIQEEPRIASELIEVPISNGASGRITLPDVPQLRNQGDQVIVITTIRLITAKVLQAGITTGVATMPIADLKKCAITLYSKGWEKGHFIPLLILNDVADADSTTSSTIPFRNKTTKLANWTDVDWNKSYIQFANGTAASQASTIMLEVEYLKLQKTATGEYKQIQL